MNNANAATTASAPADDADAPNTANRWKMDLRNHGSKFFNSLDDLIMVVDKPEELFKMLHEIGVRHKSYEVKSEHIQVSHFSSFPRHYRSIDSLCLLFRRLSTVSTTRWNSVYETNGQMLVKNRSDD